MIYQDLKAAVANRGVPPNSFLNELIAWGRQAPDALFAPKRKPIPTEPDPDIYSHVVGNLGPWTGPLHRKAAMLEVLRVLAGFESSWHWNEGRDVTNSTSGTVETEETGIFQVSCNATRFDDSLKLFVVDAIGKRDCRKFITEMKVNHFFAMEFAARLLRFTIKHNGPVLRGEINTWLSRDAVLEFSGFLS